ncbi:phospholipase A1-like [Maniola hyperantus]|uniref:phospholipase A1-like n=1 Tax=Aphantopus hyperantus TaxID=2795564 RepID=UPI001567E0F6|nr:pancreatic lipase-related protein 2-like [Maniola hyperantus]
MASFCHFVYVLWSILFCVCISNCYLRRHNGEVAEKITFYDEKGNLHYIDLNTPLDSVLDLYFNRRHFSGSTRFWLYTRDNVNDHEELLARFSTNTLFKVKSSSLYRPDRPLVMVTHGWMSSGNSNATQLIKNAYLNMEDVNVVVVDWQRDAANENYLSSASLTMLVAEKVKDMVLSLAFQYQLESRNVHLIGHSLGAHVMGLAGEKLKDDKFVVARVTGLDPAGPFFELPSYLPGITSEAASFVDIIHTDCEALGYVSNIGHADFYPNGGNWQPHCCDTQDTLSCEHTCAYVYFAESINNGSEYMSVKCDSYISYEMGSCGNNEKQFMGQSSLSSARGSFYLDI